MAALMALSMVDTVAFAAPEPDAVTLTLGELLADNEALLSRTLTANEKELLRSGYFCGDATYTFTAPDADNGSGLVQVDAAERTVAAAPYTDSGYTWLPQSAQVIADGAAVEDVTLSAAGDVYTGSFSYSGLSFSVAVTYKMYLTVPATTQNKLLGAAGALKELRSALLAAKDGAGVLEDVLNQEIQFSLTSMVNVMQGANLYPVKVYAALAALNEFDGGGIPFMAGAPALGNTTLNIEGYVKSAMGLTDESEIANAKYEVGMALKALTDDMADDGKLTYLTDMNRYAAGSAAAGLADLYADHAQFAAATETMALQADIIYSTVGAMGEYMMRGLYAATVTNTVKNARDGIAALSDYDWTALDGVMRTDLSGEEKTAVDALVNALDEGDGAAVVSNSETLLADTTVVTAVVAQATVHLVVAATVYEKGAVSTTELHSASSAHTLRASAGMDADGLAAALAAAGWEDAVLAEWNAEQQGVSYQLGTEHYDRTVTLTDLQEHPVSGPLEDRAEYVCTVSYAPKQYAVSAPTCEDIADGLYDFGYTLLLPALESEDSVYDYTVNGTAYDQNTGLRIAGATEITRSVANVWTVYTRGQLAAETYFSDNAAASAVLTAAAVETGTLRLRTPRESNDLLEVTPVPNGGYVVSADTFRANPNALWIPVSAIPVAGGVDGTPVSFTLSEQGYQARFNGTYDTVRVVYGLDVSWDDVSQEEALALLNLPEKLVSDARQQVDMMDALSDQEETLRKVGDKAKLIRSTIKGGDDILQSTKDAADDIWFNCCVEDESGVQMVLYTHLVALNALNTWGQKLAYYYANYDVIAAQVDRLYEDMRTIIEDGGVQSLLMDVDEISEYYDRLDEAVTKFEELRADVAEPDGRIDTGSAQLEALGTAVYSAMTANATAAYETVSGPLHRTAVLQADVPENPYDELAVVVRDSADNRVYNGDSFAAAVSVANANPGSTVICNDEISLGGDVLVTAAIVVRGSEYLRQGAYRLLLGSGGTLASDGALTVASHVSGYYVYCSVDDGAYVYTLVTQAVVNTDSGARYDSIAQAVSAGAAAITAEGAVNLDGNLTVQSDLCVTGVANILFGDYTFVLGGLSASLTMDSSQRALVQGVQAGYKVVSSANGDGTWTYTYEEIDSVYVSGNHLLLDLKPTGMAAADVETVVRKALLSADVTVTVTGGLTGQGLLANGATVTVSGGDGAGTYTVIVMGDTNGNGRTDAGDAVMMRNHFLGNTELTGATLQAADLNGNGRIDAGDAVISRRKYQNAWEDYTSSLKIDAD